MYFKLRNVILQRRYYEVTIKTFRLTKGELANEKCSLQNYYIRIKSYHILHI